MESISIVQGVKGRPLTRKNGNWLVNYSLVNMIIGRGLFPRWQQVIALYCIIDPFRNRYLHCEIFCSSENRDETLRRIEIKRTAIHVHRKENKRYSLRTYESIVKGFTLHFQNIASLPAFSSYNLDASVRVCDEYNGVSLSSAPLAHSAGGRI